MAGRGSDRRPHEIRMMNTTSDATDYCVFRAPQCRVRPTIPDKRPPGRRGLGYSFLSLDSGVESKNIGSGLEDPKGRNWIISRSLLPLELGKSRKRPIRISERPVVATQLTYLSRHAGLSYCNLLSRVDSWLETQVCRLAD